MPQKVRNFIIMLDKFALLKGKEPSKFQSLYPTVVRAFQLISLMYSRPTLKDGSNNVFSSPANEDIINFELAVPVFGYINKLFKARLPSKFGFNRSNDRQSSKVNAVYIERRGEFAGQRYQINK